MDFDFDSDFFEHADDDGGETSSHLFAQIRFEEFAAEVLDDVYANGENPWPVQARLEAIRQPGFMARCDWDRAYRGK